MLCKINITVKEYNGFPKLKILWKKHKIWQQDINKEGNQIIEFNISDSLPGMLEIVHFGKNMKKDTLVEANHIVHDKAIIINEISIDHIRLKNELFLFNFITEDKQIIKKNNYLGFNGSFQVDINSTDLYNWYIETSHQLFNSLEFDYNAFKKEIFA
jgi:hypothetical protein